MKHIKTYENTKERKLYAKSINDSSLFVYHNEIKRLKADAKYYIIGVNNELNGYTKRHPNYGENINVIFVYLTEKQKQGSLLGWQPANRNHLEDEGYIPYDPEIYLEELKMKADAKKYNI